MLISVFWNSCQSRFIIPEFGMYTPDKCVLLCMLSVLAEKVLLDLDRPRKDRL